jgi:hypothetical protein
MVYGVFVTQLLQREEDPDERRGVNKVKGHEEEG